MFTIENVSGDDKLSVSRQWCEQWQDEGGAVVFESVKQNTLSYFNDQRSKARTNYGLTEAMYYEALRWQSDPASSLSLNPGRLSAEAYAAQVVSQWDKIERDYNLSVSLVNQAGEVDTIAVILSRRG